MTINKFNYEAFALDYLEGKLSVALTEEMDRFLTTHPAIEAELSGMMEMVYLAPDTSIVFENKETLLKEEKVVWLSKQWIKPLMAVASIVLLLMTYFSGYQAGVQQVDRVVVSEEGDSKSSNAVMVNSEKEEVIAVDKTLELPIIKEVKLEKSVAKSIPKSTIKSPIINDSRKGISNELVTKIIIDEPEDIIVLKSKDAENELVETNFSQEVVANKELIILAPIRKIYPVFVMHTSNNDSLKNLTNALDNDVPVEELANSTLQKKKRTIKDFLGRFPVTQLKEAFIPTYYKEENAGE